MTLRKKICLLGATGVGKTSLVRRWVESMFSEDYLSTVGVKIDRKQLVVDGHDVTLLVWDIHGETGAMDIRPAYVKGAAGHLIVMDASRPETAVVAASLMERHARTIPFVLAMNKADLIEDWADPLQAVHPFHTAATACLKTSAKEGLAVEEAFSALARATL